MWIRNKIPVIWNDSYKKLDFVRQPLSTELIEKWQSQGFTNKHFNGSMYDSTNPMPDWVHEISNKIGLINCGFVFYKMTTGIIMPTHVDHFTRYQKTFSVSKDQVFRAIVFLEDWKSGHYFEIDSTPICQYSAGEFILWSNEVPHAAANLGLEDRYTLQITGIKS